MRSTGSSPIERVGAGIEVEGEQFARVAEFGTHDCDAESWLIQS